MTDQDLDHLVNQLDDRIHQRYRLGIMAFLASVDRADFTTLRSALGLTDGNLNRHLALLDNAGFVKLTKAKRKGRRARTWAQLTATGQRALDTHVAALRSLLDTLE